MAEPTDRWYGLLVDCTPAQAFTDSSRYMQYREVEIQLNAAKALHWRIVLDSPPLIIFHPKENTFLWAFYPVKDG